MEFADYVDRQRPALMRFATVLTCQPWLADDLVSDVLCRAYERWDRISQMAQPHAYVRRMVLNDYLSWRKRLSRTTPRSQVEPETAHLTDGTHEHAERDAMIGRLAKLPRGQRAAIVLRYYAGLPDKEIAEHLGCRPVTVRSQIHRALASLRIDMTPTQELQETR